MKKIIVPIALTMAALLTSCGSFGPKSMVKTTATHTRISAATPVVAVFADLDVSPNKISYFYIPRTTVAKGGFDNVVNAAVREALSNNDNADVLVGLESQVKYNDKGVIESITVTGYPAKYVNFRNAGDDYLREMGANAAASSNSSSSLGGLKLGF